MKKFLLSAILIGCAVTPAFALEPLGVFNGTGFTVNGFVRDTNKTEAHVLVTQRDGKTETAIVNVDCSRKNFVLSSREGNRVTVPYSTKQEMVRKNPTVGGYYAVYEKFCPTKKPQKQKCAMTDSGRLCGQELRDYQEYD